MTSPLPSTTPADEHNEEERADSSLGLIIPLILICVFLILVDMYHWWNQCKKERIFHIQHETLSFWRCYGRSRSARNNLGTIRDSTRSTLPLRSNIKEKSRKNSKNDNTINVSVYVIPVDRPENYSFHWDKNHWTGFPQQRKSLSRPGKKSQSSTIQKESPIVMQSTELSRNYEIREQPLCAPCYLARMTSLNALSPQFDSVHAIANNVINRHSNHIRYVHASTPATVCEHGSVASYTSNYGKGVADNGSRHTCYQPGRIICMPYSISNSHLTHSTEREDVMSHGTPFPESSYRRSSRQGEDKGSRYLKSSRMITSEPPIINLSSNSSSIAPFSHHNVLNSDQNNNSITVLNAFVTYPSEQINYPLASSHESSEMQVADDTSMIPNMGSSHTFVDPSNHNVRSLPPSYDQSGHVNGLMSLDNLSDLVDGMSSSRLIPDNLSDLVDGMSSSRHLFGSSSVRPNSTFEPTPHDVSFGCSSFTESRCPFGERMSINNLVTGNKTMSQNEVFSWDKPPLREKPKMSRSYPDLCLQVHTNRGFESNDNSSYH